VETNEEMISKNHDEEEMYLGLLEFWAMNNPVRRLSQKFIEFPLFLSSLKRRHIDLQNKIIEEPRYQFTFKELEAGTEESGLIRLEKRTWIPFYAYSYLFLKPNVQ